MADHYYTTSPDSKSDIRMIPYEVGGRKYEFYTDHGVFSISRVDHGTDILINTVLEDYTATPGSEAGILDMGCGYGPIGIVMADQYADTPVVMLDVNERAMDLAQKSAVLNRVADHVSIVKEEQLEGMRFQMVVTNPPIRAGKQTIYHLFALAEEKLMDDGVLYVVIRKNQGADSAVKELKRLFGNCETIEKKSGFHILKSIKEAEQHD